MNKKKIACPVCKSTKIKLIEIESRDGPNKTGVCFVCYVCKKCGNLFLTPEWVYKYYNR